MGDLAPRTRAVVYQIPLTATIGLVLVIAQVFHPELLGHPALQLGTVLHILSLAACIAVPWERLPPAALLVIPLADFVPIGLLRYAVMEDLVAVGVMAVMPVIWLTGSGLLPKFSVAVSFLAPLTMVWVPPLLEGTATAEELADVLVLPFMMLAIGLIIRALSVARAHKERLLNAVLQAVGVGVVVVEPDGALTMSNEQHRRNLMLVSADPDPDPNSAEATRAVPAFGHAGRVPLSAADRPIARARAGEEFSSDLVWLGSPDRQRVFSTSARRILDGDRPDGAVVTFTDVTDLMAAVTAKDVFLSNVSHELRTPLTSILGYLEMMQEEEGLPASVAEDLEVIRRNAERLERLVDDLLVAASGTVDVAPKPADLAEVIRLSLATAAPRAALADVVLVDRTEHPLPARIDPVRTAQVLDNLLSNAIKYSPGGGTITLSARRSGDMVVCEVADTGMGMSEDEAAEVFSRFFRTESARRSSIPGIGLGLAISKQIVENHGGQISCASAPGKGSVFTVTFPAVSDAELETTDYARG